MTMERFRVIRNPSHPDDDRLTLPYSRFLLIFILSFQKIIKKEVII